MAVPVSASGAAFEPGTPVALFKAPPSLGWDVTSDGKRFLGPLPSGEATEPRSLWSRTGCRCSSDKCRRHLQSDKDDPSLVHGERVSNFRMRRKQEVGRSEVLNRSIRGSAGRGKQFGGELGRSSC
jgi:hypothetical protein